MRFVATLFKRFVRLDYGRNYFLSGFLFLCLSLSFISDVKSVPIDEINNLSFNYFSVKQGLSDNRIHSILQDRDGWMWFGTSQGVCRFDGYRFTVFKYDSDDSTSLKGDLVRVIFEDRKGQLWIGTENGGLNKFNREKETFEQFFYHDEQALLKNVSVNSIQDDKEGNLWIGTETNLYKVVQEKKLIVIKPSNLLNFTEFFKVIRTDREGRILIGTSRGLFVYYPETNLAERVKFKAASATEEIWEIVPDDDGTFLIGTALNGMFSFNPKTIEATHVIIDPNNERSNAVRAISKDRNGKYWIGTRGGLYIYEKGKGSVAFYYHDDLEPSSLVNNSVQCVFHDRKGDVWIGTRDGINFLNEDRQNILSYKSRIGDDRFLNNSEIFPFWRDSKGDIWIGTESGGINILNRKTGKFRYLVANKNNPNSLSSNCIKSLLEDSNNNLWIGTYLGGLDVYNLGTGNIKHFKNDPEDPNSLSTNRVWTLLLDSNKDIWVGTSIGLDKYNPKTGNFIHFPNLVNNQHVNWLAEDRDHCLWIGCTDSLIIYNPKDNDVKKYNEATISFFIDSKNRFWLTTRSRGFALFSKENGLIRYYNEKNGLVNNQTKAILEDQEHFLWISTAAGLSRFDPEKEGFHNFSVKNGFLNDQYNYGSALKLPSGEMIFGGTSGFNIFDPAKIKFGDYFAPLVFTDLKVLNKRVLIGQNNQNILSKCISKTEKIELNYKQNSFEVEFASLNFANIMEIQYSYFLEGFDLDWKEPSFSRNATYTNLNPGNYTLHIKTVPGDIDVDKKVPVLKISILPPISQTWWFRVLILLTVLGIISLLIMFYNNREILKHNIEFEKINAKKLHDLDQMKLRFFTNISHEIRTPLTLILGPLEKLKNHSIPEKEVDSHLNVMFRNANQLYHLINQLLDFRKMEFGSMKLNLKQGELVSFISGIVDSFLKFAEEKEIDLKINAVKNEIVTNFDDDKVAKIINNLLSNALKFTGKGGKITINISLIFDTEKEGSLNEPSEKRMVEISVKDTGIGISESNQEKIFNRFFQVDENSMHKGTGIGLALTKELVILHKGKIFVTSKPGEGSKFTVLLPYDDIKFNEFTEELSPTGLSPELPMESVIDILENETTSINQKIMLLVDDNTDIRFFIKSHFSSMYKILEAKDGLDGWDKALNTIPDIIISDVLMPDMNGFEFCRKIRNDERTSHIPIVLLTALGSSENEIEGLNQGADDYITKPFNLAVLQTKVENIMSIRQSLKQKYSNEIFLQPRNIILDSPDERFLQKAIDVIEKDMSDPDLDINHFAIQMGVSRIQLYRKFHALTKMTVKDFIWKIRLKRAAQMLVQKKMNVSEVAYAIGFKHLSHFRKCFKEEFGMSASDYIKKHQSFPE